MFSAAVIHGEGVGKKIGYPTANLDLAPEATKLREGIYAAWAYMGGITYPSAVVVDYYRKKVEVHLLGYDGHDCYDQVISVDPVQKVSEIETKGREELVEKIAMDIELVRAVLKK